MTQGPTGQRHAAEDAGSSTAKGLPWERISKGASASIGWRPVWSIGILIAVGVLSYLRYPSAESSAFYSTAASVIATLYVAIALSVFAAKDSSGSDMTFEHWVFIVASSAGLLASLRGLSVGRFHAVWQSRFFTALTVVGLTATVLLVAERLITQRAVARTPAAVIWTLLFIAAAVILASFP